MVEASATVRVNINMSIKKAFVDVDGPKVIKALWARAQNSQETGHIRVDENNKIATFNSKFILENTRLRAPDTSTLTLFCDDQKVGVCEFDISKFHNNGERKFTANIVAEDEDMSGDDVVLRGDAAGFPGAYIEF